MVLRVVHVGCGGFGRRWVQVLTEKPPVEVAALVDTERSVLQEAAEKLWASLKTGASIRGSRP